MKEKIFQSLKQTFSSKYGVSEEVLQGYAESLAATGLVNDENLATVIQGQEAALRAFQQNFDRVRKEGSDYKKELDELKAKGNKTGVKPEEKTDEKPDLARLVVEAVNAAVKPLSDKLTQLEAEKVQATRQEQVLAKAKEYGIPETLIPLLKVAQDADLDIFMKDAKQTFVNAGLAGVISPEIGVSEEKNSDDIANLINKGTEEIKKQS